MSKARIKFSILSCSAIAMLNMTFTGVIAYFTTEFAGQGVSNAAMAAQTIMLIPTIIGIPVNLIIGPLTKYIRKKTLMIVCLIFAILGAIPLISSPVTPMTAIPGAVFLGISLGMMTTLVNSLITEHFDGSEQFGMMGMNTGVGNFGATILSFACGALAAAKGLNFFYLPFLIVIPILVICIVFMPKGQLTPRALKGKKREKLPKKTFFYIVFLAVYMMFSMTFVLNLTLRLTEIGFASDNFYVTAIPSAVTMLGGAICGILVGKISAVTGKYVIVLGPVIAVIGYGLASFGSSIVLICIAGFLVGAALALALSSSIFGVASIVPASAAPFCMGLMTAIGNIVVPIYTYGILSGIVDNGIHAAAPAKVKITISMVGALLLSAAAFVRARKDVKEENSWEDVSFNF